MSFEDKNGAAMSSRKDEVAFIDPWKKGKWARIDSDSIVLKGLGSPVEYEVNRVIVRQGELPGAVSLIHSGIVKLHRVADSGNECTSGLRSRGWWAGSTSVLTGTSSLYQITALTGCSVSSIPAEDFCKGLEDNPGLLRCRCIVKNCFLFNSLTSCKKPWMQGGCGQSGTGRKLRLLAR